MKRFKKGDKVKINRTQYKQNCRIASRFGINVITVESRYLSQTGRVWGSAFSGDGVNVQFMDGEIIPFLLSELERIHND